MRHADAPMNCWRKLSSLRAPDRACTNKRTPATGRGSCRCADRRKLAGLSSLSRIGGPLVGAEIAEQHLTSLQSFLREAGARPRRASVDRASGDRGAAYDRSTAYDRGAGNGIRNAHAAVAVEVGIDVVVVVGVVVAWGLRTERPWAFDADQTTRLEPRIIRHILHNRLFQHIRISKRILRLNDRLHAADHFCALNLLNRLRGCVGGEARGKADAGDGGEGDGGGTLQHCVTPRLFV